MSRDIKIELSRRTPEEIAELVAEQLSRRNLTSSEGQGQTVPGVLGQAQPSGSADTPPVSRPHLTKPK